MHLFVLLTLFLSANSQCPSDPLCLQCSLSTCILCAISFPDPDGFCRAPPKPIPKCLVYSSLSTCSKCAYTYVLSENKCVKIKIESCAEAIGVQKTLSHSKKSLQPRLHGLASRKSTIKNTEKLSIDEGKNAIATEGAEDTDFQEEIEESSGKIEELVCQTCSDGKIPENGLCKDSKTMCPVQNCAICVKTSEGVHTCEVCKKGFTLAEFPPGNRVCEPEIDENKSCWIAVDGKIANCRICWPGFYDNGGSCVKSVYEFDFLSAAKGGVLLGMVVLLGLFWG